MRHIYGPRRAEKRLAEEDTEAMREVSSDQTEPAGRKCSLAARACRLQGPAQCEARVTVVPHQLSQQQQQQRQPCQSQDNQQAQKPPPEQQQKPQGTQHEHEDLSDSQGASKTDDWNSVD